MIKSLNIYEAKTRLSELVERAARGEEIIIAKAGRPKARLVAATTATRTAPRKLGGWEGKVWMSDDFEAPLPAEVLAYFTDEADDDSTAAGR